MTKTDLADARRRADIEAEQRVWDMKVRGRMSDAEANDRLVAYWSYHWRDKYVLLLTRLEEIKELTK